MPQRRPGSRPPVLRLIVTFAFVLLLMSWLSAWVFSGDAVSTLAPQTRLTAAEREAVFLALWTVVRERYVSMAAKQVDWDRVRATYLEQVRQAPSDEAFEQLLQRAIAELHDTHSYLDFPADQRFQPPVRTMMDGYRVVISAVAPRSAAEEAGLAAGMEVVSVDGKPAARVWQERAALLSDSTPYRNRWNSARTLLWGKQGTRVTISARQPGGKLVTAILKRDMELTEPQPFESRVLAGGIVYLRLSSFDDPDPTARAIDVIKQAAAANAPGLIIDLRGNRGGDQRLGLNLADYLTAKPATWGYVKDHGDGEVRSLTTQPAPLVYQGPVLALTDPGCISACDMLATFLQRSGRGKLVGEPPGGATFNSIDYRLPHGYTLHLAGDKELLGPDREPIEGRTALVAFPIAPTAQDWAHERDPVLETAVWWLNEL